MTDTTTTTEKTCRACGHAKTVEAFNKCKASRDGLQGKCRRCEREYKQANREREARRANDWYVRNRESKNASTYEWLAAQQSPCLFSGCDVLVGYYSASGMCPRHAQYRPGSGYQAAHVRVRSLRGSASCYECSCGCGERADDYAYQHNAGASEMTCSQTGLKYSLDPDHYLPMARSCHRMFDMERR